VARIRSDPNFLLDRLPGTFSVHIESPPGGPVDLLLGFDGSSSPMDAAKLALGLFGPRVPRVTLATVPPSPARKTEGERAPPVALDDGEVLLAQGVVVVQRVLDEVLEILPDPRLGRAVAVGFRATRTAGPGMGKAGSS
jgi:hypothetical protein